MIHSTRLVIPEHHRSLNHRDNGHTGPHVGTISTLTVRFSGAASILIGILYVRSVPSTECDLHCIAYFDAL